MFLLSVEDIDQATVERVLARAECWQSDSAKGANTKRIVGLLFLESSLRTRAGFAAAAARLGWQSIEVGAPRWGSTAMPESWEDTLRTFAGFVDMVVTRPGRPLERETVSRLVTKPLVNGGDTGQSAEHPSQALIDLFALRAIGPVHDLAIGICGDLRMRTVRSLLRLLARTPPHRLALISNPALVDDTPLPAALAEVVQHRSLAELDDLDALYVAGMPHECLPEAERAQLRITPAALAALPSDAVVLSPLPVLDEIDADARLDPRVRMFEQSDAGIAVRMALLEELADVFQI